MDDVRGRDPLSTTLTPGSEPPPVRGDDSDGGDAHAFRDDDAHTRASMFGAELQIIVEEDEDVPPLEVPDTGLRRRMVVLQDVGSGGHPSTGGSQGHLVVSSGDPSQEMDVIIKQNKLHHFRVKSKQFTGEASHTRVASTANMVTVTPSLGGTLTVAGVAPLQHKRHLSGGSSQGVEADSPSHPQGSDIDSCATTASSGDIDLEVEHDSEDDEEELATYKAKKYAQLNKLNRMAGLMVVMLVCAFILGIAALVSEEWYTYVIQHDYTDGRGDNINIAQDTFSLFSACYEGSCDEFSGLITFTSNFFPSLFAPGNGTTIAPSSVCRLSVEGGKARRGAAQTFAIIYIVGISSAAILSVAVNMRPTLERTQGLITLICLASIVCAAMPVFAIFGATFIQPLLLCGKGLCEYAMEAELPGGVSARRCGGSAVYGLWLFFGSNCACLVALIFNLSIIYMLVNIKLDTEQQMRNLRQHRVETYLYRCIQDAEEDNNKGEIKQLRHMLGVVLGVKTDPSTSPFGIMNNRMDLKTPRSTLAPRNDRIQFGDVDPSDEGLDSTAVRGRGRSRTMRLTRQQLVAPLDNGEELDDHHHASPPRAALFSEMAGVTDWIYDDNSQFYYSYTLEAFWDPLCREYYDEITSSWVPEHAYLERIRLRRCREPDAEESAFPVERESSH